MILLFFNPSQGGGGAPNQFSPPTRHETPRYTGDTPREDRRFLGRWRGGPVAVNVYKLKDGSYTEAPPNWDDVAFTYYGGRRYTVSDDEKQALTNAGYTVS